MYAIYSNFCSLNKKPNFKIPKDLSHMDAIYIFYWPLQLRFMDMSSSNFNNQFSSGTAKPAVKG